MTAVSSSDKQRPQRLFAIKVVHRGEVLKMWEYFIDSLTAMEQMMLSYPQATLITVCPVMPMKLQGVGVELC